MSKRNRVLKQPALATDDADEAKRDEVRARVREGRTRPEDAELWAAKNGYPPFSDAYSNGISEVGVQSLDAAWWPLSFATLWIAYDGNREAVAREWAAFHVWRRGLWRAKKQPDQIRGLEEAERELWSSLQAGSLVAHGVVEAGKPSVAIQAFDWARLEWKSAGLAQAVGFRDSAVPAYALVCVEAAAVRKHWAEPRPVQDIPEAAPDLLPVSSVRKPRTRPGPAFSPTVDKRVKQTDLNNFCEHCEFKKLKEPVLKDLAVREFVGMTFTVRMWRKAFALYPHKREPADTDLKLSKEGYDK